MPVPSPPTEEIIKTGKRNGKKSWITEESVRAAYDKYTEKGGMQPHPLWPHRMLFIDSL